MDALRHLSGCERQVVQAVSIATSQPDGKSRVTRAVGLASSREQFRPRNIRHMKLVGEKCTKNLQVHLFKPITRFAGGRYRSSGHH
jgi:hypothetical protein